MDPVIKLVILSHWDFNPGNPAAIVDQFTPVSSLQRTQPIKYDSTTVGSAKSRNILICHLPSQTDDKLDRIGDGHIGSGPIAHFHKVKLEDTKMPLSEEIFTCNIPQIVQQSFVTGQWNLNGNLNATVGKDLEYFDGPDGQTAATVQFNTCSNFGIPLINGVNANVMYIPGFEGGTPLLANYGFIMRPGIAPNGGGAKVNEYTIIYDLFYNGDDFPFFQCQNTNMPYGIGGSLFLIDGTMGQGPEGYTMNNGLIGIGWHRLAFAVDLSRNLISKWVDGVKAQDWISPANSLDAPRRAWQSAVLLFADNDGPEDSGDHHTASIYVKSIQVSSRKLTDSQMIALGGPSAYGIPLAVPLSVRDNKN